MQLVLGREHEELKERNQEPSVVLEQLVSEKLFHLHYILDKSNQLIIGVQQHITLSIQLCHDLSHSAVLALPAVCISKLTVWAPTRCTLADRAQTVDCNLSTIHAERIQMCTAPAHLQTICQHILVYPCMYLLYTMTYHVHIMYIHVCSMYVPDHQRTGCSYPLHKSGYHVNNMGNTCMMEPEPVFLLPFVWLSKSGTLTHTWHHAQNPQGVSLARHN